MHGVYISVDMEGLTGAVSPDQVLPDRRDYERFRRIMISETNAALKGAFDAGATQALVNDSHDGMVNMKLEDLDERASLISGYHKPMSMMEGLSSEFSCAFFIGYHSMASGPGVLSHTMSGIISRCTLNGIPASEGVINAMIAGHFGVPVALVCGDDYATQEVIRVCPSSKFVITKRAIDRYSAENMPLTQVEKEIQRAAREGFSESRSNSPFVPDLPLRLTVEFTQPSLASRVRYARGFRKVDERTVEMEGQNPLDVYKAFRVALALASGATDQDYG